MAGKSKGNGPRSPGITELSPEQTLSKAGVNRGFSRSEAAGCRGTLERVTHMYRATISR